ncbi:amidase, partial [Rhizobium leguminosarum]
SIDRETNHAALPFHLGRINSDNGFDVVASRPIESAPNGVGQDRL